MSDALGGDGNPDRWLQCVLQWLDLDLDLVASDLDRVPQTGPLIVAAEHPTGAMEGILLLQALRRRRRDVKVLANKVLQCLTPLREMLLPVDVHGDRNATAVRGALQHLLGGGALLVFPAGEVAWRRLASRKAREAPWRSTFAGLQRHSNAQVVPVHVAASNPSWFHLVGWLHRHARTALLPRALLAQRGRRVAVRIGHPIAAAQLTRFGEDDGARTDYLRLRTSILARRTLVRPTTATVPSRRAAPIALRHDVDELTKEIAGLPKETLLVDGSGMHTFCVDATRIPVALAEIGRLRELTFRSAGEGTGEPRDLDRFDAEYKHLFVWSARDREIVGAYRLGLTDELLERGGARSLYTDTFYEYSPAFWKAISPAIELGRSFVQPKYQRAYAPLLLLWRGIGTFVSRHPRYRHLFGTVSISADHDATSVRLMIDHLRTHCSARDSAAQVRSRQPWAPSRRELRGVTWQPEQIAEIADVSAMVRELETGRTGVPVLLEQYLKLGGKLLGVNVDPDFRTIDALVVVDLLAAPPSLLRRYLGEEGAATLRDHHRGTDAIRASPGVSVSSRLSGS